MGQKVKIVAVNLLDLRKRFYSCFGLGITSNHIELYNDDKFQSRR